MIVLIRVIPGCKKDQWQKKTKKHLDNTLKNEKSNIKGVTAAEFISEAEATAALNAAA